MTDWRTATIDPGPNRRPLSDHDRAAIAWMYRDQRPMAEIAGGVGRCIGTTKTAIRALRAAGLVGRRYGVADKHADRGCMTYANNRAKRLLSMLTATNGGPVSQDLILAVLWPNCGRHLNNPTEAVRRFIWLTTRGTDIRVRRQRADDYVLYQLHA